MNLSSLLPSSPSSSTPFKRKRDPDSFDEPRGCKRAKYDIFMNYSSKDIGDSFISHLRGALERNDFTIPELHEGPNVCSELMKLIEDSDIYLVVFSCKYVSCVRCLDELVDIMDCFHKYDRRKVFPVFFKVEPSDVRNQEGVFKEAFEAHETNFSVERVEKWRQAMKEAGQLSGHHLRYGDERKFLKQIVRLLGKMKNPLELFDATHPVGIESRAQDIITKLRLGVNVFTIVAVLGIGGSGKTTIVKAVYDRIAADFDARCFIENIHDYKNSGRNWKVDLQEKVIASLTGNHRCHNIGAAMIKKLISARKVLLVLDNVDEFELLRALGIHHADSFGCRSRIIVTTRNKQSLSILPYTPYEISLLNRNESFELFTGFAFGKDEHVDKNFVKEIVWRAEGIPLVLEVWGRHFKCHERNQWPSVLETLKRIPHGDIQKQLLLSYDSLNNRSKKLFLDIVYFFYGMKKDLVVKVLQDEDSGFFPDIEIQYLVDKSLVKIDYAKVTMHHAIREMGEEVVHQENEDEPGQRTRLMDHTNVVRVLRDCSGTESVESLSLSYSGMKESVTVHVEAFTNMINLRFIKLLGGPLLKWSSSSSSNDDMPSFSLKKLKYLEWNGFPCRCIDNIDMGNVVVIRLYNSKLEILWERFKSLKKLRLLDVSYSRSLKKTGNFVGLESLEELLLINCENLEELDGSIGCLEKLVTLDLGNCTRLKKFPWEMIGKLTSLVQLNLERCPSIFNTLCEVPDSLCQLRDLESINLYGCVNVKAIPKLPSNIKSIIACDCMSLVNLPSNISELQFLRKLYLYGCLILEPEGLMKVTTLRNLQNLGMRNCNVSQVSSEIENLLSLRKLDLSENTISSLPDSFSNLSKLKHLEINDCSRLKSIPNLPPNIERVTANDCISLVNLPSNMSKLPFLKDLSMRNCNVNIVSSEIGKLVSLKYLDLSGNPFCSLPDSFSNLLELNELKMNDCSQLALLPLLPLNLKVIEASECWSLDATPYESMQKGYIFRSKMLEESFFTGALHIGLSGKEVPDWCNYRSNGHVLSFVTPIIHMDNKICGVIICATLTAALDVDSWQYFSPTMLNKTKETSHHFYCREFDECSLMVAFYPLNDTILEVETGDTMLIEFKNKQIVSSCGLRWIYEGDVVDNSAILIRKQLTEPPFTLTVPSSEMTDVAATSIT